MVADAERQRDVSRIDTETAAEARRIEEESKAQITQLHMLTQAEAREAAASKDAKATVVRAKAASEAQSIQAEGLEREAGARGRAEMEVEALRAANVQRQLEAEASGIEAKANALKKYNDSATFLELARLHIEAERDVHIDQAKAMGTALSGAHIRMFGGEGGTVDTLRGLFTSGFGLGEALEGVAESLPEGLKERLASDGIRGLFRRPEGSASLATHVSRLTALVSSAIGDDEEIPFADALERLDEQAGEDLTSRQAVTVLRSLNVEGRFDDVPFATAWRLLQAMTRSSSS